MIVASSYNAVVKWSLMNSLVYIESEVARRGTPLLRDVAVIRSGSGPALSASCPLYGTLKRANRLKLKVHSVTLLRRLG